VHWHLTSLGALTSPVGERSRPDLPLLSVVREKGVILRSSMTDEENHNFVPDDLSNYKVAHEGSLVINKMKAWQGSLGIAPLDGIVSPAYFVFDLKIADKRFGQALLRSKPYVAFFGRASDGVRIGQWDLSIHQMKRIPVAVPPVSEQTAIVRFLDYADRRIQRYIHAKKKLIALLNEQKQAIIHRAVTQGLDPNVRLKPSGVEWLGDVPEHWEVKKLRLLFQFTKGGRAAEITNEYIGKHPGPFPVYSGQTEGNGLMGNIAWHEFDFRFSVIFVSTVGARAMSTRLVTGEFSLSQNCALLIPRSQDANASFFENVLQRLFSYERASISLIMQPSLRFSDLNRFYVPHPPLTEQADIVRHLGRTTSRVDQSILAARREISLLGEYRTRLIADVVTGKLDVREAAANLPDDEPAAEPFDDLDPLDQTDEEAEDVDLEAEALPA
jgi:type I restriction enzyme, S subunit